MLYPDYIVPAEMVLLNDYVIPATKLSYILFLFVISFFFHYIWLAGAFCAGMTLYKFGSKKLGHYLIAQSGFNPSWLVSHCPYKQGERCRAWTCPGYCKEGQTFCRIKED